MLHLEEADELRHHHIGCEHLLLGMLADEHGPVGKVLATHGVTLEAARRWTNALVEDSSDASARRRYTPRATVILSLARVEAERLGEFEPINDVHILLAIITEAQSAPMHLFSEFGVDVGELREDLLNKLEVPDALRETYLRQREAYEEAMRQRRQQLPDDWTQ